MQKNRLVGLSMLCAVVFVAVNPLINQQAETKAHCQVPCGIYGDQLRFEQMLEDEHTISKAQIQINELSSGEVDAQAINQLGRGRPSRPETWANKQIWAPAFQVEEVGATGAGDASIAGFLSALLRNLSPEEAITAATAVGACNVEATDGVSGIRPWQETLDRVAAGWSRRELALDEPDWQFNENRQLWLGSA